MPRDAASSRTAGTRLLERWDAEAVLISRGEHGMALFRRGRPVREFATAARDVFDVTGAGDTVVATCALALGAGATLEEATVLANHAAGIVVGKVGTATVTSAELAAALRMPAPAEEWHAVDDGVRGGRRRDSGGPHSGSRCAA